MKVHTLSLVLVSLLAGCASAPPPVLPEEGYTRHAAWSVATDVCAAQGNMGPELAAYGKLRMSQNLAGYQYDHQKLAAYQESASAAMQTVPVEKCRVLAVEFAGLRDEYERNSRASQNNQSQYTNCYSGPIGTNCINY